MKLFVRCRSGASVLVGVVVLFCMGVLFEMFVLFCVVVRVFVELWIGVIVSELCCDFGGLSGMFLIAIFRVSLMSVLFLPRSCVLWMLAMMSETAGLSEGIL